MKQIISTIFLILLGLLLAYWASNLETDEMMLDRVLGTGNEANITSF